MRSRASPPVVEEERDSRKSGRRLSFVFFALMAPRVVMTVAKGLKAHRGIRGGRWNRVVVAVLVGYERDGIGRWWTYGNWRDGRLISNVTFEDNVVQAQWACSVEQKPRIDASFVKFVTAAENP